MEGILQSLQSIRQDDNADPLLKLNQYQHYGDNNIHADNVGHGQYSSEEDSFLAFSNALRQFLSNGNGASPYAASANHTANTSTNISPNSSPNGKSELATWLYNLCSTIPSPLSAHALSLAVLSSITTTTANEDNIQLQSSLFDVLGESEESMLALFDIMAKASLMREQDVREEDLIKVSSAGGSFNDYDASTTDNNNANDNDTATQLHQQHLNLLRSQAYETADLATALRTNTATTSNIASTEQQQSSSSLLLSSSRGTHSVTRASDKEAEKNYKRALKQASVALNKAKEAGALTESDELFLQSQLPSFNTNNNNNSNNNRNTMEAMLLRNQEATFYNTTHTRGIDGMTAQQLADMKRHLLPSGTREYTETNRGLPHGTEREIKPFYEKVTIPAPLLDASTLPRRIHLNDVMGPEDDDNTNDERRAFAGTDSLNPMQSTVFDAAYRTRENLLICAPTGAGKTNVAMLAVVSHLRDVGLIGQGSRYHDDNDHDDHNNDDDNEGGRASSSSSSSFNTGKKIVYIAPMKALAQEVVEKFGSKMKPLGIIVRELTGDMQLSRAEAEAAHVSTTM